jgi:acyl-CoA thioester hydrolase
LRRAIPLYTSRVDLPSFRLGLTVTDEDIDPLGHANNIAYLRWVQDVAVAHSAAVGLGYEAYCRIGAVFVVRRHEIDYLRPALRGDELEARTWICGVMAAKCERKTEIVRPSDGVLVAKALTVWGFVAQATGRPTRITDEVKAAFAQRPDGSRVDPSFPARASVRPIQT